VKEAQDDGLMDEAACAAKRLELGKGCVEEEVRSCEAKSRDAALEAASKAAEQKLRKLKKAHDAGIMSADELAARVDALAAELGDDVAARLPQELLQCGGEAMQRNAAAAAEARRQQLELQAAAVACGDNHINPPGKWDFFLSHFQAETAALAEGVYGALVDAGYSVWFDVEMPQRSEAAMEEGVRGSNKFIALASPKYFERPFCLKELRWARDAGKTVVPCHDRDDKKSIGAFLQMCPEDLRGIGGIDFVSIDFVSIDRSDDELFEVGVRKVIKKGGKIPPA
jgi:hypothetical protein